MLYMLFYVWNEHVYTVCHGEIYSKQNFSHAFTLRQTPVTCVDHHSHSVPSVFHCAAWGVVQPTTRRKNRMINNIISPLIMLVQSGKWIPWKRCQDIVRILKWAWLLFVISTSVELQQVWFYTDRIMCFQVKINSSWNKRCVRELLLPTKQQRLWFIPGQVQWSH